MKVKTVQNVKDKAGERFIQTGGTYEEIADDEEDYSVTLSNHEVSVTTSIKRILIPNKIIHFLTCPIFHSQSCRSYSDPLFTIVWN